ncbi:hypothetical protein [Kitasatospora sp. DSM 101779]|uniref:hypothetical protein n=1 Tax=Kitasatospora sp. DSM 101779 TaxID=2853165 RepID=UPI0021D8B091|nr:hypothetical protein [Kitasatospora sp. DSM 101779]MCU7825013.1 hypothetical protein [Kitasatospora sp. DSM 101779]
MTPHSPERDPICSLGAWLFVPDRHNAAGDVETGYLVRNGRRVVLWHCSRILADFLRTLRRLESRFAVPCSAPQPPGLVAVDAPRAPSAGHSAAAPGNEPPRA